MSIMSLEFVCSCGSALILLYICLYYYMFFFSLSAVDFIRRMKMNIYLGVGQRSSWLGRSTLQRSGVITMHQLMIGNYASIVRRTHFILMILQRAHPPSPIRPTHSTAAVFAQLRCTYPGDSAAAESAEQWIKWTRIMAHLP